MVDNDTEVQTKGLRASNTITTLRPTEVTGYETPSGGHVTMEEILAPQKAYEKGVARVIDEFVKYPESHLPVQKTDLFTEHEQAEELNTPGQIIEVDDPRDFLPVGRSLAERVEKLEGQVDGLLYRIAKYNIRAQHRI